MISPRPIFMILQASSLRAASSSDAIWPTFIPSIQRKSWSMSRIPGTPTKRAIRPLESRDQPEVHGAETPYELLHTEEKYSWVKSPRYNGMAMEARPLSRTLIAYAARKQQVKTAVDGAPAHLNLPLTALFSKMGRIAARAIEARNLVGELSGWVAKLDNNIAHGNLKVQDGAMWNPDSRPKSCQGRSTTGLRLQIRRWSTIRPSSPQSGMQVRVTLEARPEPTNRHCAVHRSLIPTGRSRCSGSYTHSILAWRVRFMWCRPMAKTLAGRR